MPDTIWIQGTFSGYFVGHESAAMRSRTPIQRFHDLSLRSGRVSDVTRVAGPLTVAADVEPTPMRLGTLHNIWVASSTADAAGAPTWYEATLHDCVLHAWTHRLASDEGDRSVLEAEGVLVGRVQRHEPALIPPAVGSAPAAPPAPSFGAAPASGPAAVASSAAPGCLTGCLPGCMPGCAPWAIPLAALLLFLGLFGWKAALIWLVLAGLAALLPSFGFFGRLFPFGMLPNWLRFLLGAGLLWALLHGLYGLFTHAGGGTPSLMWLLIAVPLLLAGLMVRRAVTPIIFLLAALAFLVSWLRDDDRHQQRIQPVTDWVEAQQQHDPDADLVARASQGAPGPERVSVDTPAGTWQDSPICGKTIHMSTDLLFGFNQADLKPAANPSLRELAAICARSRGSKIRISGHSDQVGSEANNQQVSQRRADAVADWLVAAGAVQRELLTVEGLGSTKPVVDDRHRRELGRFNRRVEVVIQCKDAQE